MFYDSFFFPQGNDITLRHYISPDVAVSPSRLITLRVPLYEQFWERQNGQISNREHFLMALADLKYILIKATYATNTDEVAYVCFILYIM